MQLLSRSQIKSGSQNKSSGITFITNDKIKISQKTEEGRFINLALKRTRHPCGVQEQDKNIGELLQ